jgi:hypothetical protein
MWETSDWVRLSLLLILSLGATGISNWLAGLVIAGILAFGCHWLMGWPWAWGLQANLAVVFVLPLVLRMLWNNFRASIVFAGFLGMPTFFSSIYVFNSTLIYATADSIVFMHLLPLTITRLVTKTGFSEKINTFIKFKYIAKRYPQLLAGIKNDLELLENIKHQPDLIIDLEKYPNLLDIVKRNPTLIKIIKYDLGFLGTIENNQVLLKLLENNSEIIKELAKFSSYQQILDLMTFYPEAVDVFKQRSDFLEMLRKDSILFETIKIHPEFIRVINKLPSLITPLKVYLANIKACISSIRRTPEILLKDMLEIDSKDIKKVIGKIKLSGMPYHGNITNDIDFKNEIELQLLSLPKPHADINNALNAYIRLSIENHKRALLDKQMAIFKSDSPKTTSSPCRAADPYRPSLPF